MKFLALGTSAENHIGSLEQSFGNQIPGAGCAAPRGGREGAGVPRRPQPQTRGAAGQTSSGRTLLRFKTGLLNLSLSFWEERAVQSRSWAYTRKGFLSRYLNEHCLKSYS